MFVFCCLTIIHAVGAPKLDVDAQIRAISESARQAAQKVDVSVDETIIENSSAAQLLEYYEAMADGLGDGGGEKEIWSYHCKYIQATTARRVLENFISSNGT
ncbi:MAG: hypothetical protein ACI8W8_004769, partial [Rhodothermales bacterium]